MRRLLILKGGSDAIHKIGNIKREEDDWITYHEETETHYIGNFEFGYGFVDVRFKKEDCRLATKEEIDGLRKCTNSLFGYSYNFIKYDGYFMDEHERLDSMKCVELVGITDMNGKYKPTDWSSLIGQKLYTSKDSCIDSGLYLYKSAKTTMPELRTSTVQSIDSSDGVITYTTKNTKYVFIDGGE